MVETKRNVYGHKKVGFCIQPVVDTVRNTILNPQVTISIVRNRGGIAEMVDHLSPILNLLVYIYDSNGTLFTTDPLRDHDPLPCRPPGLGQPLTRSGFFGFHTISCLTRPTYIHDPSLPPGSNPVPDTDTRTN